MRVDELQEGIKLGHEGVGDAMVLQVSPDRDGLVGELEQPGVEQNSLSKGVPKLGDFGKDAPKIRPETGPQVSVDQLLVGAAEPGKESYEKNP